MQKNRHVFSVVYFVRFVGAHDGQTDVGRKSDHVRSCVCLPEESARVQHLQSLSNPPPPPKDSHSRRRNDVNKKEIVNPSSDGFRVHMYRLQHREAGAHVHQPYQQHQPHQPHQPHHTTRKQQHRQIATAKLLRRAFQATNKRRHVQCMFLFSGFAHLPKIRSSVLLLLLPTFLLGASLTPPLITLLLFPG